MPTLMAPLDEAREHLRVIRQTMERSTKYSTLSGLSGVLIGLVAIVGVWLTHRLAPPPLPMWIGPQPGSSASAGLPAVQDYAYAGSSAGQDYTLHVGVIWLAVLALAIAIDFVANKRRAARVGKTVMSPIGGHIILAALPAFFGGAVLTYFLLQHNLSFSVWGVWMLCYGLAICAVGLFSVKPVSVLGGAFVLAGAVTLLLPPSAQLPMMALTFGGFHIGYGILMARRHGW